MTQAATLVYGVMCLLNFGQGLRPCHGRLNTRKRADDVVDDAANTLKWWTSEKYTDGIEAEHEMDDSSPFLVDK
jgi:hypothetical protein